MCNSRKYVGDYGRVAWRPGPRFATPPPKKEKDSQKRVIGNILKQNSTSLFIFWLFLADHSPLENMVAMATRKGISFCF